MSAAELVNLILNKLTTAKVTFIAINSDDPSVGFELGGNVYTAYLHDNTTILVVRHVASARMLDNYSDWVECVLNGKTRDEEGVMRT